MSKKLLEGQNDCPHCGQDLRLPPDAMERIRGKKGTCKICGRTDLEILSNGLCTRCDREKYGPSPTPFHPYVPYPYNPWHDPDAGKIWMGKQQYQQE